VNRIVGNFVLVKLPPIASVRVFPLFQPSTNDIRLLVIAPDSHKANVIYDASLDALLQKVWDGHRIDSAEALRLYSAARDFIG